MANASLTWLGHATFRIDSSGGKRIYVDPWLDGNPKLPDSEKEPERVDLVLVTHGHGDHVGSALDLGKRFGAPLVCMVELAAWLSKQGYPEDKLQAMNKGGTQAVVGQRITMTHAFHSSSTPDGAYAGEPAGFVLELDGGTKLYFAGDTAVFGDMQLIGRLYSPDVAVLPIGDFYTMGPREAGLALELLGSPRCVPCHWGTFPLLTGTPNELRKHAPQGVEIVDMSPGDTIQL
jgi:L-ascorbate metabolism protein UlaG (beta-lactamase superfamily)